MQREGNSGPFRTLFGASWEATREHRGSFFGFVALFVVSQLLRLADPWALREVINAFTRYGYTDQAFEVGIQWIFVMIALQLLSASILHFGRYIQFCVGYQARMYTLEKMFSALLRLPLPWHAKNHSGDNIAKLNRVQSTVLHFIEHHLWQLTEAVVRVVVIVCTVTVLSYYITGFVVLGALIPVLLMVYFNRRLLKHIRSRIEFDNKLTRISLDYLSNIITVKTMGVESAAQRYLGRQRREGLIYTKRFAFLNEARYQTFDVGNAIIIGASLFLYVSLERQRGAQFDVGMIYVLINYLNQIVQTIWSFAQQYSNILETWASFQDGQEILREAEKVEKGAEGVEAKPEWQELSLNRIFFRYSEGRAPALNNLSLTVRRGERVAIVGPNGGGKSTLMKALSGLLPATFEGIRRDDFELTQQHLANRILLIPQEPEVFNETFRYNITLGEEFSDQELEAAANLAVLRPVLDRLPLGWDTNLLQKGLNLSGGEKQRIALARGILRAQSRDLILLDEPTSSVDSRTEKMIFENLITTLPGKTIISSLHRLQLIPFFDRIVLVEQGTVVEDGSVVDLLRQKGEFYKIWSDFVRKSSPLWEEGGEGELDTKPTAQ